VVTHYGFEDRKWDLAKEMIGKWKNQAISRMI